MKRIGLIIFDKCEVFYILLILYLPFGNRIEKKYNRMEFSTFIQTNQGPFLAYKMMKITHINVLRLVSS